MTKERIKATIECIKAGCNQPKTTLERTKVRCVITKKSLAPMK